jgi:AcrR family transcriptional regulator
MEQIAERAGVARRTVYRRFGSKETVAERLAARELQRFLATVRKTINAAPDPGTSAVEAFVAVMRFAASHPLIDRLARIEPNVLLETMRAGDPSPMEIAGAFVADRIRSGQRKGKVPVRDADELADVLVHLALSYILLPSQVVDLSDDDRLRAFAHSAIAPILSPPEAAGTLRP